MLLLEFYSQKSCIHITSCNVKYISDIDFHEILIKKVSRIYEHLFLNLRDVFYIQFLKSLLTILSYVFFFSKLANLYKTFMDSFRKVMPYCRLLGLWCIGCNSLTLQATSSFSIVWLSRYLFFFSTSTYSIESTRKNRISYHFPLILLWAVCAENELQIVGGGRNAHSFSFSFSRSSKDWK